MNLVISTYTNQYNTGTSSINAGAYRAKLRNTDIVTAGSPQYVGGGDGQELKLAGVKLNGKTIEIDFSIVSGVIGDGFDFVAALFDKHDTNTKTLTMFDMDDSIGGGLFRSWYVTGRNLGVSAPKGKNMVAKMALDAEILYTTSTNTETTFAVVADAQTQDFTISVGNISALPVIDISPQTNGGIGQRYWRFCTVFNYTKNPSGPAYPIDVTNGGLDTSALINFTGISVQVNNGAGYNSSATTIAYDTVVGTLPSVPFMLYRAGEQMRVTARTGTTSGNLTVVRGVNASVATSHADNVVLALSKMAFDGRDIRVLVGTGNGNLAENPYWFGDTGTSVINNTATKIWTPLTIPARATGTLTNSIVSGDISLSITSPDGYFPPSTGLLLIGTEIMSYASYDASTATTPDLTRGVFGTTAASHTAGDTVRHLDPVLLYYGDANASTPLYLSQAASNVAVSQALRPPFARGTSTNSSWAYLNFAYSITNLSSEWKTLAPNNTATTYTKDNDPLNAAPVDPVTDLGVSALNRNGLAQWQLSLPFGYTVASYTTLKRYSLPANAGYVGDASALTAIAAGTGGSSTTGTFNSASVSFLARILIRNTTSANWGTRAYMNAAACTLTLSTSTTSDTDGVPSVSLGSENSVTYDLYASLTNTTTGAVISFKFDNMALSSILRIDTLNKTVSYVTDGRKTNLLPFTPRSNWLELRQGTNTLRWNFLNGVNGTVNVIVKEQYRNNSFG